MRNAHQTRSPVQDVVTGARAIGLGVAMGLIVYAADEAEITLHETDASAAPTPVAVAKVATPSRPVYLPSRPWSDAPAPVPVYLQPQFKASAPAAEPIPTF